VVLFEMLTGRRPFLGDTVTDVLAAVVGAEPTWADLPVSVPAHIRRLLRRCLAKDRKNRLQAIGDARLELDENPAAGEATAATRVPRRLRPWAVSIALLALVAVAVVRFRGAPKTSPLVRFSITAPENVLVFHHVPSPDGRLIAFSTHGGEFGDRLVLRRLGSSSLEPIPGTEGAMVPFWSPDGRYLGYFDLGRNKVMKVDLASPSAPGSPETICDSAVGGATWNRDNVIVFGSGLGRGIYRVSARGGEPAALTKLDSTRMEKSHLWPYFLPDGRHFLYTIVSKSRANSGIFVGSLDSPGRKQLLGDPSRVSFVKGASGDGFLVFAHSGRLMSQRFDPRKMELSGESVPIADVQQDEDDWADASFGTSESGLLIFQGPYVGRLKRLTWFDRTGKVLGAVGDPVLMTDWGLDSSLALSPDGKRVALARIDPKAQSSHILLIDIARGAATRLTANPADNPSEHGPIWSPDGKRLIFGSTREGRNDLYWKDAESGGQEELLIKSGFFNWPNSCSPDGRFLAYTEDSISTQRLMLLPLAGDRTPIAFEKIGRFEGYGIFSPDGNWIAVETGGEIFVRAMKQVPRGPQSDSVVLHDGGRWQISSGGGRLARWRRDGRELYYLGSDGKLVARDMKLGPTVQAGVPKSLFTVPAPESVGGYAVTADGQRFLIPLAVGEKTRSSVTVMLNWTNGLGLQ
jgi:Tol biopolymer transport system component